MCPSLSREFGGVCVCRRADRRRVRDLLWQRLQETPLRDARSLRGGRLRHPLLLPRARARRAAAPAPENERETSLRPFEYPRRVCFGTCVAPFTVKSGGSVSFALSLSLSPHRSFGWRNWSAARWTSSARTTGRAATQRHSTPVRGNIPLNFESGCRRVSGALDDRERSHQVHVSSGFPEEDSPSSKSEAGNVP